jgi:hypothetical protein
MSFLASSSHLNLGLPFGLVAYGGVTSLREEKKEVQDHDTIHFWDN